MSITGEPTLGKPAVARHSRQMRDTLDELEACDETKVVVIAGEGGVWSAGQDLKEYFRGLEDRPAEAKRIRMISNGWQWDRLKCRSSACRSPIPGSDAICPGGVPDAKERVQMVRQLDEIMEFG